MFFSSVLRLSIFPTRIIRAEEQMPTEVVQSGHSA
jgi:hypothetical protein